MSSTPGRDKGASFLRVFRILEAVVDANRPLTAAELAKLTGLPAPTTHRLCKMLLQEQFLQNHIDGRHIQGGPRLFSFGGRILSMPQFDLERRAILESLVEEIGETCNIAVPEGTRMIYADRVESHWPLRIELPIGTPVPLHCTASGKLYLASLDAAARRPILERLPLSRQTTSTVVDVDELESRLEETIARGYATDDEEFMEGLVAVSVPIRDVNGRFCAGLAVHAPKFRMPMAAALDALPELRLAAGRIEELVSRQDTDAVPLAAGA